MAGSQLTAETAGATTPTRRGLTYCGVGYEVTDGATPQTSWNADRMRIDRWTIEELLHASSVSVFGDGVDRLTATAAEAAERGLHIYDQAAYLTDVLGVFEEMGLYSATVYEFVSPDAPHRNTPRYDLDLACYGLVKAIWERPDRPGPGWHWQPKEAFFALARPLVGRRTRVGKSPWRRRRT